MLPSTGIVRVLITVKAAPQVSTKYRDTVCVAGLYLPPDGPPEHIRLYPVPFRYLTDDQKFKKYDMREIALRMPSHTDDRPESRSIEITDPSAALPLLETASRWRGRAAYVEQVRRDSMCSMVQATRESRSAQSLGLIEPSHVKQLHITKTEPLSTVDVRTRDALVAQQELNLFGEPSGQVLNALRPPPFNAKLEYFCSTPSCGGHTQGIIDWELTAFQINRQREGWSDERIHDGIVQNFFANPFAEHKRPALFVGNQANPGRRTTFSVLSIYSPPVNDLPPSQTLF